MVFSLIKKYKFVWKSISLDLCVDGQSLTGAWAYSGQGAIQFNNPEFQWNEQRVSSLAPRADQCWQSAFESTDTGVPNHTWEIVGEASW